MGLVVEVSVVSVAKTRGNKRLKTIVYRLVQGILRRKTASLRQRRVAKKTMTMARKNRFRNYLCGIKGYQSVARDAKPYANESKIEIQYSEHNLARVGIAIALTRFCRLLA